jgi:branched-chain amino acid transport system permease protein
VAERLPAQPSLALQRAWRVAGWAVLILAVLCLPRVLEAWKGEGFPKEMGVWVLMAIYMIVALGCNVIVGYTGLLNLGFAGFMCIGAYTAAVLMKDHGWSLGTAVVVATAHGALWGILLGIPTLRLTGDYFAIVTLGFTEIILLGVKNWTSVTGGTSGFRGVPRPEILWPTHGAEGWGLEVIRFGRLTPVEFWYVIGAALILTILVMRRLEFSRVGRAWAAIREDELAAQAAGINITWYKTLAFAISGAVAGFGGGLYAAFSGNLSFYDFNFFISVYLVLYVVFGGMGSITGTLLGTLVLFYLLELLRDVITGFNQIQVDLAREEVSAFVVWLKGKVPDGQIDANLRYLLYAAALILIMRYRPTGLLPPKARLRERLPRAGECSGRLCHLAERKGA